MTAVVDNTLAAHAFPRDRSRPALDFVHKLLHESQRDVPLPDLLKDLTESFAALRSGVISLHEAPAAQVPGPLPWQHDPQLLIRVRNTATALPVYAGASWLLTTIAPAQGDYWLLWLEAPPHRVWTSSEEGALYLAGQALGRLAGSSSSAAAMGNPDRAAFQQRLELTGAVAGRLAHDFSNILTGILGFAELSLVSLPAGALARPHVDEVLSSAQHGADWVRKLQTFSRRLKSKGGRCTLQPIVAEQEKRFREAWAGAIAFLVAPLENLPPLAVNAESLRDMIEQLLENSREAVRERGVVTLEARAVELTADDCLELIGNCRPGSHVEITVTDTGCGIGPENRQRLASELFFSTKNRQRGLGFPIVFACLSTCQGGFRFGPDPAQGTTVKLFLPVGGP